jgi:hypothetical protein
MLKPILLFVITSLLFTGNNYQKIFGDDYTDGLNYFTKNKLTIENQFVKYHVDKKVLIPILFPERVRFSMMRDILETSAVEVVYIEYGSDFVDFSIGDFQLKPSFASKIEMAVNDNAGLRKKYAVLVKYKKTDIKEIREERVERLKSLEFQLIYISAFYDIVIQKFNLSEKTQIEKIAFFATAYNYGFLSNMAEIEAHMDDKYFPYGSKYKGKQYAYSDVSVDFYHKHYSDIFNSDN